MLAGGSEPPGSPAAAKESAPSSSWRKGRTHDMKIVSNGALWAGCIKLTLGMLGVLAWAVTGDIVVTDWATFASTSVVSFSPQESLVSPSTIFWFNGKIE